jgi:hypothetical protein
MMVMHAHQVIHALEGFAQAPHIHVMMGICARMTYVMVMAHVHSQIILHHVMMEFSVHTMMSVLEESAVVPYIVVTMERVVPQIHVTAMEHVQIQ